ncbi:hypothetical protein PVAP13_8KG120003 [Panicum virgatum]|nr:hypothetical protein PVAP13_8KG120003 [Panicum virgatum]
MGRSSLGRSRLHAASFRPKLCSPTLVNHQIESPLPPLRYPPLTRVPHVRNQWEFWSTEPPVSHGCVRTGAKDEDE